MKTCDIEGCTAPESQLMPCPLIGGIVYFCKFHTRLPRKAVTFSLEWNEDIEAALCQRCRRHMQQHYHGELCRKCGAQFTINRAEEI